MDGRLDTRDIALKSEAPSKGYMNVMHELLTPYTSNVDVNIVIASFADKGYFWYRMKIAEEVTDPWHRYMLMDQEKIEHFEDYSLPSRMRYRAGLRRIAFNHDDAFKDYMFYKSIGKYKVEERKVTVTELRSELSHEVMDKLTDQEVIACLVDICREIHYPWYDKSPPVSLEESDIHTWIVDT